MGGFFQWIIGNLQLFVYAAVFVVPVIGWISRQLREQAAKQRAESERKRRELEDLRTGGSRSPEDDQTESKPVELRSASAPSPAEELARRRQAQLEELRRRAAQRAAQARAKQGGGAPVPTQSAPTQQAPAQPAPPRQVPTTRPQRPQTQQPRPPQQVERPQPTRRTSRPSVSEIERRRDEALAAMREAKEQAERAAQQQRAAAKRKPKVAAAARTPAAEPEVGEVVRKARSSIFGSRKSIRAAIIASEVLGKPRALREEIGGGTADVF